MASYPLSSSGTAVRKAELGNEIESARQDDIDVKKVAEKQGWRR